MGEELTIIRKPVPAISPTMRDLLAVMFRQRRLALSLLYGDLSGDSSDTACWRPPTRPT